MVDNVGGFINKFLKPLKDGNINKDSIKNDKIQTVFFEKLDKNNDSNLSTDEAAILNNSSTEIPAGHDLYKQFASVIQKPEEQIEGIIVLDGNNGNKNYVVTMKEENGVRGILTFEEQADNKVRLAEVRNIKDNIEEKTTFNEDGTKIIEKGAVKTTIDDKGRVTSVETDKGDGVKEKIEYEYEGDSTTPKKAVTTKPDGTKTEQTDGIKNPNDVKDNTTKVDGDSDSDSDVDTDVDSDSDSDDDNGGGVKREGPIYAKEGETFKQTAKRLGFEEGTEEYKQFAAANPKAAKKGWFQIGKEITIPDSLKDKLKDEAFGVDADKEEQAYVDRAKNEAKTDKYNDQNTEKQTLDKDTNWWTIAKQNLIATGKEKPTNKEIFERLGEIMKLNEGKEPKKGTEITVPKAVEEAPEATQATEPSAPEAPEKPSEKEKLSTTQINALKALGFTDAEIAEGKEKIEAKLKNEIIPKKIDEIVPVFKNEEWAKTAAEPVKLTKIALQALLFAKLSPYSELKEKDGSDNNTKILENKDIKIEIKLENGNPIKVSVACKNPETGNDMTITFESKKMTTKEGNNENEMALEPPNYEFEKLLNLIK